MKFIDRLNLMMLKSHQRYETLKKEFEEQPENVELAYKCIIASENYASITDIVALYAEEQYRVEDMESALSVMIQMLEKNKDYLNDAQIELCAKMGKLLQVPRMN